MVGVEGSWGSVPKLTQVDICSYENIKWMYYRKVRVTAVLCRYSNVVLFKQNEHKLCLVFMAWSWIYFKPVTETRIPVQLEQIQFLKQCVLFKISDNGQSQNIL